MRRVSRRGFIVLGGTGAAGLALASCGEEADPRDDGRDEELLTAALSAEITLQSAYDDGGLTGIRPTKPIDDMQQQRIDRLDDLGAGSEGSETGEGDVLEASNAAIAAYRELAGLGSTTEIRSAATQGLVEVAAVLAAVRTQADADPAPFAFVTGGDEPYEPEVSDDSAAGTTSTAAETETTTEESG